MKKKSADRLILEAIALGKLPNLPTNSLKYRKLQKEELTNLVKEEFSEAKSLADTKAKEGSWGSVELENLMNWNKTLGLEKAFKK
ncbi:MAG: hypothetical protein Q8Q92_03405 [bacterium]|nr:hypothetical protein [bacterium]